MEKPKFTTLVSQKIAKTMNTYDGVGMLYKLLNNDTLEIVLNEGTYAVIADEDDVLFDVSCSDDLLCLPTVSTNLYQAFMEYDEQAFRDVASELAELFRYKLLEAFANELDNYAREIRLHTVPYWEELSKNLFPEEDIENEN
jgi:hypothetical protein